MPPRSDHSSPIWPTPLWPTALWPTMVAYTLYFFRFGYDYGHSDQDEILPYLLHRLDPGLLAQDWFVQTQATGFNVRRYFVGLMEPLATLMPLEAAVLVVYLVAFFLIGTAVYALLVHLLRSPLAAALGVVVALVFTPQWTLGGNDLVHRMLVPSMMGWGLGLWGLVLALRTRWGWASLLLGVATWMQVLVGLQLTGTVTALLGLAAGASPSLWRSYLERGLRFLGTYLIFASPALAPILLQQWSPAPSGTPSLFYILAAFRAPHHYLFHSFPEASIVRLLALLGLGLAVLGIRRLRNQLPTPMLLFGFLGLVGGICGFAYVFTEVTPSLFITKLQLFKLTVLAKVVLVGLIAFGGIRLLPNPWIARLEAWPQRYWPWIGAVAMALGLAIGLWAGHPVLQDKILPQRHATTAVAAVERWAQEQDTDAVFIVPPSFSGFRTRAERGVVVTFKAYPFQDAAMYDWFQRLQDVAPLPLPTRGGAPLMARLDSAYAAQQPEAWHLLADRYGAAYLVHPTWEPPPGFALAYRMLPWSVYQRTSTTAPTP